MKRFKKIPTVKTLILSLKLSNQSQNLQRLIQLWLL